MEISEAQELYQEGSTSNKKQLLEHFFRETSSGELSGRLFRKLFLVTFPGNFARTLRETFLETVCRTHLPETLSGKRFPENMFRNVSQKLPLTFQEN